MIGFIPPPPPPPLSLILSPSPFTPSFSYPTQSISFSLHILEASIHSIFLFYTPFLPPPLSLSSPPSLYLSLTLSLPPLSFISFIIFFFRRNVISIPPHTHTHTPHIHITVPSPRIKTNTYSYMNFQLDSPYKLPIFFL